MEGREREEYIDFLNRLFESVDNFTGPDELSADEQKFILAYRSGKATDAVNLLKAQGDLPASFPTRPDMP